MSEAFDFFGGNPGQSDDERVAGREATVEDKIVRRLLARWGRSVADAKAGRRADTGDGRLSIGWFEENVAALPLFLVARAIPRLHEWPYEALVRAFTKTPYYRAMADAFALRGPDDDRSVAVVFQWPGLGLQAVHDGEVDIRGDDWTGIVLVRASARLVIEPWEQLEDRVPWPCC